MAFFWRRQDRVTEEGTVSIRAFGTHTTAGVWKPYAKKPPDLGTSTEEIAAWIEEYIRPTLHTIAENTDTGKNGLAFPEFEVRGYQTEALAATDQARKNGETIALIHMAPGLGKTTITALDYAKFRDTRLRAGAPEPNALFISPQHSINNQAAERFRQLIPDTNTYFFRTNHKRIQKSGITFATSQSLCNALGRFGRRSFNYIVYDEAHHACAETYQEIVRYFQPDWQLAMTATPYRTDGKDIREYFSEPLYSKPLTKAIAEGLLADVDYRIMLDESTQKSIRAGFHPKTLQEIHDLFAVDPPLETVAKSIQEERRKLGLDKARTAVFCTSTEHAKALAELMGSTAYHSGMDLKDQKQALHYFKTGEINTMCTVDMFNEGVDIPDVELIVFLRGTQSRALFEQQLGRGLRRTRHKKKVVVLDYVANVERIAQAWELARNVSTHSRQLRQQNDQDYDLLDRKTRNRSALFKDDYSDFIFDKFVVNLLARITCLKAEPARPGELSIEAFSKQLGINYRTLVDRLDKARIPILYRQFGKRTGRALTLEMQQTILDYSETQILPALKGEVNVTFFAKSIGVDQKTVRSLLNDEKNGLTSHTRRFPSGRKGTAIDLETQEKIITLLKERKETPPLAKDEMTYHAFARANNMKITTLKRLIEDNSITTIFRIHPANNKITPALSPDAQWELLAIIYS